MYDDGRGVPQDYKEAVKWYRKAAEQGHAIAQVNLGVMYGRGNGVLQDNIYAHMWFNIAVSNGKVNAAKGRDIVAKAMTAEDITKAQELARECVKKVYKGC
jgi:TPR repeat protein